MSTSNKNGNGAKEVTPATANKTGVNGKTDTPATPPQPTTEELKAQALKEQRVYFDGLAQLVFMRGRYQEHKEAVEELTFEREATEMFEHGQAFGGKIVLTDFSGNSYEIKNPKLVMEVRNHLLTLFTGKIEDLENGIFAYAEKKQQATPTAN
ncbi:hypothetical protein QQ054_04205 [Oscillatoria amoena NRMC-F 0135]|nr:hypothetical protein [Oscillatoria amoena NRMC-F 0135]